MREIWIFLHSIAQLESGTHDYMHHDLSAPIFAQRWEWWWNNSTRLALQDGHTKVRNVIFATGKATIFLFLECRWLWLFTKFVLLFTVLHGPCHDSKHGKHKKHGLSSDGCCIGPQWSLPGSVTTAALSCPKCKKCFSFISKVVPLGGAYICRTCITFT